MVSEAGRAPRGEIERFPRSQAIDDFFGSLSSLLLLLLLLTGKKGIYSVPSNVGCLRGQETRR